MRYFAVLLGVVFSVSLLSAQTSVRVVHHPSVPPGEALARMGLALGWNARIPIQGNRDGPFSVQVFPGPTGIQLVVQTQAGQVALLDGETGDLLWRTQVGEPYWVSKPAAANRDSIFVTRRHDLHVLSRVNGRERIVNKDKGSGATNYGISLDAVPSAGLAAEDEAVFVPLGTSISAYLLPVYDAVEKKKGPPRFDSTADLIGSGEAKKYKADIVVPVLGWNYRVQGHIHHTPILAGNQISVFTAGELVSVNKFEGKYRLDFRMAGTVSHGASQHGAVAYIGDEEGSLYAINMSTGNLAWRFLGPAAAVHRPAAIDSSVFLSAGRAGLFRIDRETGREVWRNTGAERFLAASPKFVYAADRQGNFLVLDGARGDTLARYDLQEWNFPVVNEFTDRVYLASNDGQLLCLHQRDLRQPVAMKSRPAKKVEEKQVEEKKAEETKAEETKAEEKKAEEKQEEKKEMKEEKKAKKDEKKAVDNEDKKDAEKKEDKSAQDARPIGMPVAPEVAALDKRRREGEAPAEPPASRWQWNHLPARSEAGGSPETSPSRRRGHVACQLVGPHLQRRKLTFS